jgi:cell wall assembly regulator SMI1
MQEIWNRIHAGLSVYAPNLILQLQPGASDEEIRETEAKLGIEFPKDVFASYQIHNGMCGQQSFICGWSEFHSLDDIFREWEMWKDLLETGHFIDDQSEPEGPIKTDAWNIRWIPLLGDGGGDYCCLDLDPPPEGQLGQIITMWHESGADKVLSPSFGDFLANFADELNAGVYTFSEEYGGLITLTELKQRNTDKQEKERQFAQFMKQYADNPKAFEAYLQEQEKQFLEIKKRFCD